jgi:hypothetical protein
MLSESKVILTALFSENSIDSMTSAPALSYPSLPPLAISDLLKQSRITPETVSGRPLPPLRRCAPQGAGKFVVQNNRVNIIPNFKPLWRK